MVGSDGARRLSLEAGNRSWDVLLLTAGVSARDLADILASAPSAPELVLLPGPSPQQQAELSAAARHRFNDGIALLASPDTTRWGIERADSFLVLGQRRLVERFTAVATSGSPQPPAGRRPQPSGALKAAIDPGGFPPFPEAASLDPLGLDRSRRRAAWGKAFNILGRLARGVHDRGFTVTWPKTAQWGYADSDYKPWRTVAKIQGGAAQTSPPIPDEGEARARDETGDILMSPYVRYLDESYAARAAANHGVDRQSQTAGGSAPTVGEAGRSAAPVHAPARGRELPLILLQRALLSLHASAASSTSSEDSWSHAAELIEELGYLGVSCAYSLGFPQSLMQYLHAGLLLGRIHQDGHGYGDMHLGNFMYSSEDLPIIVDYGGYYNFARGGTASERAGDLAVLRLSCNFLQWQAAMLGYRLVAPEIADAVFAAFPDTPRSSEDPRASAEALP